MTSLTVATLHSIRDKYAAWTDPLSQRLKEYLSKTDNPLTLGRRIEVLTSEILVNPFNERIPLQSPVLDRVWVWEESFLSHYQQQTGLTISPFDGQPINAKPHAFAREILALVRSTALVRSMSLVGSVVSVVRAEEGEAGERGIVATVAPCREDLVVAASPERAQAQAQLVYTQYWVFAQRFIQRELCRQLNSSIGQSIGALTLHTAVSKAKTEHLKEKNAAALARLSNSCAESSASIKDTEKTTIWVHQPSSKTERAA